MKLRSTPVTENPFLVTVVTQTLVATNDQFLRRKSWEGRAEKMGGAEGVRWLAGLGLPYGARPTI